MKILLVEDNKSISKSLQYSLEQKELTVICAFTYEDALEKIDNEMLDLIILDISLPDGNGFDLYKDIIRQRNISTIFLTARDNEEDIVKGLELGAEDYVTKPFSTKELMARINRILNKNINKVISIGNIKFDFDKMELSRGDNKVSLTSLETRILLILFSNLNRVVTREYLIQYIWNLTGNDVNDNTITVYMKRIREKIGEDIIVTVKGVGYRIDKQK